MRIVISIIWVITSRIIRYNLPNGNGTKLDHVYSNQVISSRGNNIFHIFGAIFLFYDFFFRFGNNGHHWITCLL